jgi:hypothetical protein
VVLEELGQRRPVLADAVAEIVIEIHDLPGKKRKKGSPHQGGRGGAGLHAGAL